MHRLYEKFILGYYKYHYKNILDASAPAIDWITDNERMLPGMFSDIVLYDKESGKKLIIDAKYYAHTLQSQFDKYSIHSNNLYQIFTYVKNKDAEYGTNEHEVAGLLLYAQTDEAIQPNEKFKISGNWISVQTLNLNTEFYNIAEKLNYIADTFFESI